MIEEQLVVGLVVERRELTGQWGGVAWRPTAIFAEAPDVAPWTSLGGQAGLARFYVGAMPIHLYSTDTTNYRDNLTSTAPKLWVVMRSSTVEPPLEVLAITADPAEGEGNTEAGNNIVETIDMPPEIAAAIAQFIATHHVDRPTFKRQRDGKAPKVSWPDGLAKRRRDDGPQ
jgi:hypothetical protein